MNAQRSQTNEEFRKITKIQNPKKSQKFREISKTLKNIKNIGLPINFVVRIEILSVFIFVQ